MPLESANRAPLLSTHLDGVSFFNPKFLKPRPVCDLRKRICDMRKRCFDDNSKTEYNSDLEISFVPTNLMITVFLNNVSEYIRSF